MEKNFRHENKFLISRQSAELLKIQLPRYMSRDPHVGESGTYTIRSLYFDDLQFHAFAEKAAGVNDRIKYRIRCYDYSDAVFRLEKKEKHGDLSRKTGQTVTKEQILALQRGVPDESLLEAGGLIGELLTGRTGSGLRPRVLVDYDRTPFVCSAGNTRITLDENVRTIPYCADLFAGHGTMIPVLEEDRVILEVKFDDFLPGYLSECLQSVPKAAMAVSKFALCLSVI